MRFATATLLTLGLTAFATQGIVGQERVESLPSSSKLVRIEAQPASIHLKQTFDYTQLLLTGILANGDRLDVTRMAKIQPSSPVVKVSPRGEVRPTQDGQGTLTVTLADKVLNIPVQVSGQKAKYEVNFVRDVMPVMAKMGCNAGTCHGSAKGRNGFQLSLRGYDPIFDYGALTDDIMARRFNRAAPEKSLMLMKPTGETPHVGGVLTQPGEPYYEVIRSWIADGVKFDPQTQRVRSIEVSPASVTIPLPGLKQQIVVIATLPDGSRRDVSAEAFIESSNTEVATVDKQGVVTAVRRGETAMLARYEGSYAAASLIVMGDRSGFTWQPTEEYNWIDALVYDKLKLMKIQPSDVCTDTEFLRRIHLDLTGLPPEPEQIRDFLKDPRPSRVKRDALVDKLVGNPDYIDHWTNKWGDLLQVNSKFLGTTGTQAFRDYIRKAVAGNMPYDQFARSILTASGSNMDNPAAAYWKILRDPAGTMENTTHLFLAVRFNCNKCHDHPFERWTQDNYYHLAAYFAQVGFREDPKYAGQKIGGSAVEGAKPLVEIVSDGNAGDVKHERTGETAKPSFPFTHGGMHPMTAPQVRPGQPPAQVSRRQELAQWITAPENPYFARSYVNRLWSYMLGVGLIEPVDDIRAGNPATNPQLLERLTQEFIKSKFDVQALVKTICKSRTYQHSIATNAWNKDDETNYSHGLARSLPAEVLYDAIHRVTGSQTKLPGLAPGSRAAQIVDVNAPIPGGFLELLGRPARESSCECERSNSMLLGPVLNLINGPVVGEALGDPSNRLAKLLAKEKDNRKVVEELFLAILGRMPSPTELKHGMGRLEGREPEHREMQVERDRRTKTLAEHEKALMARYPEYEANLKRQVPEWVPLQLDSFTAAGATLTRQMDGSVLASGKIGYPETYRLSGKTAVRELTAIRLEVLTDKSLPKKGPGRAPDGNFVLSEFRLDVGPMGEPLKMQNLVAARLLQPLFLRPILLPDLPLSKPVKFVRPQATANQGGGFEVDKAIDGNLQTGWAISPQVGKSQQAVFEVKDRMKIGDGDVLRFTLEQHFNTKQHALGRVRLSVTASPTPINLNAAPENIAKIILKPTNQRTPQEQATLVNYYRGLDQELPGLQRAVAEYQVPVDPRGLGAQDLAWALINSRAFLFNY